MEQGQSEIDRFENGVDKLLRAFDKLPMATSSSGNYTDVKIDSSSLATFILSIMCAFLCGVIIVGVFIIFNMRQDIDTNSDYVHAIYMQIPKLQQKAKHNEQPDNHHKLSTASR